MRLHIAAAPSNSDDHRKAKNRSHPDQDAYDCGDYTSIANGETLDRFFGDMAEDAGKT